MGAPRNHVCYYLDGVLVSSNPAKLWQTHPQERAMTSMWPVAVASLDDALALLGDNVERLKAAQAADIAEMLEQLKSAAASAHAIRELISADLPEASWQSRAELDAIIAQEAEKSPGIGSIFSAELGDTSVGASQASGD
jgi:hypothetical protein